jgi:hypothetical protein
MNAGEKRCCRCGETKPEGAFHVERRSPDGLARQCKECRAAYLREARRWEPGRDAERMRRYRAEHPEYREREAERVRRLRAERRAE